MAQDISVRRHYSNVPPVIPLGKPRYLEAVAHVKLDGFRVGCLYVQHEGHLGLALLKGS